MSLKIVDAKLEPSTVSTGGSLRIIIDIREYGRLFDNSGAAILDGNTLEITMSDGRDYTSAYSGSQMDQLAEMEES